MSILLPGVGRVTLALMAAVPAAMAYPWQAQSGRWILGVAATVVLALFGSWRGLHLTTIVRRRLELLFRSGRHDGAHQTMDHADADARTTVALRVLDGSDPGLPLEVIRGYLDRYGLRCESLRVTSRDTGAERTTWISLTMSATANLVALQARSPTIPLRETAEITLRRLADHLREHGWSLATGDLAIPDLQGPDAKEHWRGLADTTGYLAAYSLAADSLLEVLNELWSYEWDELWTAIEMSDAGLAAGCVIRTAEMPAAAPPMAGLIARRGNQWQAVRALVPTSTKPLDAEILPVGEISTVRWPVSGRPVD